MPPRVVSPGFVPRPSLSGVDDRDHDGRRAGVAGACAPAFVERSSNSIPTSTRTRVSPAFAPRPPVAPLPAPGPKGPLNINGRTSDPRATSSPEVCSFQLPTNERFTYTTHSAGAECSSGVAQRYFNLDRASPGAAWASLQGPVRIGLDVSRCLARQGVAYGVRRSGVSGLGAELRRVGGTSSDAFSGCRST